MEMIDAGGAGEQSATPAAQVATGGESPWYGQVDEQTQGWIQSKGWDKPDAPQQVLRSYREAEKLIGTIKGSPERIIVAPKDFDNKEEVDAYYNKLGRPEAPEKYSVYADNPVIKELAAAAFEAGVSDKGFKALTEKFDGTLRQLHDQQIDEWNNNSVAELESFKREVGAAYEQKVQFGKMAAAAFPELKENMDAIEQAMGTANFMKFMSAIGEKIGEDTAVGLGGSGGFIATPAHAKQQVSDLQNDQQFMAAYINADNPQHQAAVEKMQKLMTLAYPE